jgi:4-carboxymuconolactone decarboxylase
MADDALYEKGIAIREEMFGPEHGRAKVESQPDFTREFEELVTRYCFGSVWGREELSRGVRSMLTVAMLVALGRAQEIRVHVMGAINNGVSKDELREVLIHSAIYCGIPAAVDGFRNASAVLAELGWSEPGRGRRPGRLRRRRHHGQAHGCQPRQSGFRAGNPRC